MKKTWNSPEVQELTIQETAFGYGDCSYATMNTYNSNGNNGKGNGNGHTNSNGVGHTSHGNGNGYGHTKHGCDCCGDLLS